MNSAALNSLSSPTSGGEFEPSVDPICLTRRIKLDRGFIDLDDVKG
jgi:hypothetical protein